MPGLLIGGKQVTVPNVNVTNQFDAAWARLRSGDCRPRPTRWVRQVVQHTTKGRWPQSILPGEGSGGRDKRVADYWAESSRPSGAHIVTDNDGTAACLADLVTVEAFHATVVNKWSVGIESYQESGNGIYQRTIDSTVEITLAICRAMGIQFQIPKGAYLGKPLRRLVSDGGPSLVGVIGHRDVTHDRGRGDPGDYIMEALVEAGAEELDFDAGEDLAVWIDRQKWLVAQGHAIVPDGIPGPKTVAALKAEGYPDGIWAFGRKA